MCRECEKGICELICVERDSGLLMFCFEFDRSK